MDEADLSADPVAQLARWLQEAESATSRPDVMTLATADSEGRPSARHVLLKGLDERGLVFFTNRRSRKARELAQNPNAALVFHWYEQGRQVRVEGGVTEVDIAESQAYWRTRPRGSQVAAWASPQSEPIASRAELERRYAETDGELDGREISLPPFWGGYRVTPEVIEFWEHRDNRLHDRARYLRSDTGWSIERLAP